MSYKERLLVSVAALAVLAATAACGSGPLVAGAASSAPAPLAHHSAPKFTPAAVVLGTGRTTGEVGLTSVLPGRPATFRVQVAAHTTCEGSVAYSGSRAAEQAVLESISAGSAGELSWTWDTPADVSPAGGYVSMTCGGDTFRIPFGISAPEVGLLSSR